MDEASGGSNAELRLEFCSWHRQFSRGWAFPPSDGLATSGASGDGGGWEEALGRDLK